MSEDDEVLPVENDLSKFMISQGFNDFETFKQDNGCSRYKKIESSSVTKNNIGLNHELVKPLYISSFDHSKLMNLLHSKLLLPEDFEILEFLISRTVTSNCQTKYLWVYSGGVIASTLGLCLALYHSKRVSLLLPAAVSSVCSFLCLRQWFNIFHGICENKSFMFAVATLQKACLNVHKLLRLLKETEILSTGQVTTHNVGAALYIPVKNFVELETLPSWKTLPHVRDCLANALLDMVDLLNSTCSEARKIVPDWLHIEGYTFSNESSSLLNPHFAESLRGTEGCISLKDLQLLNDSYLLLQSEFLRWVGFCLSPTIWNKPTSDSHYKSSRMKVLKLLYNTHSKLSIMSFKLQMHYEIQKIFSNGEQLNSTRVPVTDINSIQSGLHHLFLLILSMLTHLRTFEDQLENSSNCDNNVNVNNLKENMNHQLNNIRHELKSAIDKFDAVCLHTFSNLKSSRPTLQSDMVEKGHLKNIILKPQINLSEENPNQSDPYADSLDEVYLAVADLICNESERHRDDWGNESNPPIPNNLLEELSSTLKPIKENFKEREKAALERAGLQDIVNESDSDNKVTSSSTGNNFNKKSSTRPATKRKKKRNQLRRINYESTCGQNDDSESDLSPLSMDNSVHTHAEFNPVQSITIIKSDTSTSSSVLNDKSVANLVALKSQSWGLAEEEYYSDD